MVSLGCWNISYSRKFHKYVISEFNFVNFSKDCESIILEKQKKGNYKLISFLKTKSSFENSNEHLKIPRELKEKIILNSSTINDIY